MKPLDKLTIVEKAKLLHELFPVDIISFIVFAKYYALVFIRDKIQVKQNWSAQDIPTSFDYWQNLVTDAQKRIEKYEHRMSVQSNLFADQLFDGNTANYSIECLRRFAASDKCNNPNMSLAIHMFFL
ncbi:MAG: hypothetical protein ABI729_09870 [Chitinophagales bacterium]